MFRIQDNWDDWDDLLRALAGGAIILMASIQLLSLAGCGPQREGSQESSPALQESQEREAAVGNETEDESGPEREGRPESENETEGEQPSDRRESGRQAVPFKSHRAGNYCEAFEGVVVMRSEKQWQDFWDDLRCGGDSDFYNHPRPQVDFSESILALYDSDSHNCCDYAYPLNHLHAYREKGIIYIGANYIKAPNYPSDCDGICREGPHIFELDRSLSNYPIRKAHLCDGSPDMSSCYFLPR